MTRSKKPKYKDIYASVDANDKYFGTLFGGMLKSEAYQKLSLGAKQFYTYCRVQAKSSEGTSCLYKHGEECGENYTDHDFVFPAKHLEEYNIKRSNANRYFNELIAAGFIEIREKNKHRKKVNVYSFSTRWKDTS